MHVAVTHATSHAEVLSCKPLLFIESKVEEVCQAPANRLARMALLDDMLSFIGQFITSCGSAPRA